MTENYSAKAINTIYDEREKFVIIGLTGRTGSGCTTLSKILCTPTFEKLCLPEPQMATGNSSGERKYRISYKYAQKHWKPFMRISMTDIIFSFMLEKSFDELMRLMKETLDADCLDIIRRELEKKEGLAEKYTALHEDMLKCLDERGSLRRLSDDPTDPDRYFALECDILERISAIQEQFRGTMLEIPYKSGGSTANSFTYCLQHFGNRLRHHGDITENGTFTGEHMFALARRANDFIKAVRRINIKEGRPTFICLDAIRNPYEATYFQDRYSAFFLIAVNTDDRDRKARLRKYNEEQIRAMDETEYPKKAKGSDIFTNQNIGACSQIADIYLYNPDTDKKGESGEIKLKKLAVKYVSLIMHPGLFTPTSVERCMQAAYNAKLSSGCLSRQVGAVITDADFSIKAIGWNSAAAGQPPCNLRMVTDYFNNSDNEAFSDYEKNDETFRGKLSQKYGRLITDSECLNGRLCSYCFKDEYAEITGQKNQVHTRSLHAEENAFLQIAKYGGEGIKGGKLFTSASSCVLCSKKAFQLGIKDIYYIDPYTDIAMSHIISTGKKEDRPALHLFYGVVGRAYTYLFTQRIAIKDELECLMRDTSEDNEK
ncbi:MAG: dCMP deaminase [Ruminiclostridium sp.]|nr:dCMP deaminase [Ruminiclostridium sp.]